MRCLMRWLHDLQRIFHRIQCSGYEHEENAVSTKSDEVVKRKRKGHKVSFEKHDYFLIVLVMVMVMGLLFSSDIGSWYVFVHESFNGSVTDPLKDFS